MMDKQLDARFERVERSLQSLIDSVAKYGSSSVVLSGDLAAVDHDLVRSLHELQRHQNHVARIEALRRETDALDARMRDAIAGMWGVRQEVKATQTSTTTTATHALGADGASSGFTSTELLNYARRISRNILPPPGVTNGFEPAAEGAAEQQQQQQQQPQQSPAAADSLPGASFNSTIANTAASFSSTAVPTTTFAIVNTDISGAGPSSATPSQPTLQQQEQQEQQQQQQHQHQQQPRSSFPDNATPTNNIYTPANPLSATTQSLALPEGLRQTSLPGQGSASAGGAFPSSSLFLPWPVEEQIRGGGLMACQAIVDAGLSARGYDPAEEERRRWEEEEVALRRAEVQRAEMARAAHERERARREEALLARERERERAETGGGLAQGRRDSVAVEGSGGGGGGGGGQEQGQQGGRREGFMFMDSLDDEDE